MNEKEMLNRCIVGKTDKPPDQQKSRRDCKPVPPNLTSNVNSNLSLNSRRTDKGLNPDTISDWCEQEKTVGSYLKEEKNEAMILLEAIKEAADGSNTYFMLALEYQDEYIETKNLMSELVFQRFYCYRDETKKDGSFIVELDGGGGYITLSDVKHICYQDSLDGMEIVVCCKDGKCYYIYVLFDLL